MILNARLYAFKSIPLFLYNQKLEICLLNALSHAEYKILFRREKKLKTRSFRHLKPYNKQETYEQRTVCQV